MHSMIDIIFELSIWGSFLTLLVLILGLFTKNKFYKTLQYYMWLIVILRFLIPVFLQITIKSNNTIYQPPVPQYNVNQNVTIPVTVNDTYETPIENITTQNKIDIKQLIINNIWIIWFAVFSVFELSNILLYIKFKQKIFKYNIGLNNNINFIFNKCKIELGINCKINLFQNSYVSTPMLIGIFKPTILIPEEKFEEEDLELIFKHELMHYQRKDMLVKHITNFAVCVHWFNPFIYLVRNQINRYCELSCDEAVIKILDKKYYKAYGDIILKIAQNNIDKNIAFVSTLNGDKNILKERLVLIMNYKKISKKAIALSTSLLVSMSTVAVFSGTTFASSQTTTVDSTQYNYIPFEDLTQEEIDLFSNILDKYEKKSGGPQVLFNIYGFSREFSDAEMKLFDKYRLSRPKPKNNIPIDDKSAEFYYDTDKFLFVLPSRDLTEEEILEYNYLTQKMTAVQSKRTDKLMEEEQNKELEKLTNKDISKEKAEEIAKAELKSLNSTIDITKLNVVSNFDSILKQWRVYLSGNEGVQRGEVEVDSQTGKIVYANADTRNPKDDVDSINIEEAKKTDIWKTESEKFLKEHIGETKTPVSIFSYANTIYYSTDDNKMKDTPGETVTVVFKYDDNTSYKIRMLYDTHKIISYRHERIIDLNNRIEIDMEKYKGKNIGVDSIYIDKPEDVKYLITVYK